MSQGRRIAILAAVIIPLVAIAGWWQAGRTQEVRAYGGGTWSMLDSFGGRGLPLGGLGIMTEAPPPSPFDLLFSEHGRVSYRFHGTGVSAYIAHYHRDERVLHELVTGISTTIPYNLNGFITWGVTTEQGARRELRVRASIGGGIGTSYFDMSQIDFPLGSSSTSHFNKMIELGERYILHVWQSGGTFWADGNHFLPERLRENERTTILYVVFE